MIGLLGVAVALAVQFTLGFVYRKVLERQLRLAAGAAPGEPAAGKVFAGSVLWPIADLLVLAAIVPCACCGPSSRRGRSRGSSSSSPSSGAGKRASLVGRARASPPRRTFTPWGSWQSRSRSSWRARRCSPIPTNRRPAQAHRLPGEGPRTNVAGRTFNEEVTSLRRLRGLLAGELRRGRLARPRERPRPAGGPARHDSRAREPPRGACRASRGAPRADEADDSSSGSTRRAALCRRVAERFAPSTRDFRRARANREAAPRLGPALGEGRAGRLAAHPFGRHGPRHPSPGANKPMVLDQDSRFDGFADAEVGARVRRPSARPDAAPERAAPGLGRAAGDSSVAG